uniref:VWFA domain-containing protein n=1 Tax=Romanomermis culicivorax TaxID=13658 RepID=A0A915KL88_ROMCU
MESMVLKLPFNLSEIFVVQNSMIVKSSEGKFHHVNKDYVDFYVNPIDAEFDMNDLKRCVDSNVDGYLEVIDFNERNVTYIPVPAPKYKPPYPAWYRSLSETNFVLNSYGQEGVVTVDSSGGIRTFETSPGSLRNSINAWRKIMGIQNGDSGKITIEKEDADFSKLSEPKHGVTDPTGAPHFGGGTFAGGSGGFNTAGLGGAGGPYRLDLGHKEVHQVSDDVKSRIPEHVRQKAREMARRAYAQRLKEIHMSEHEAELYEKFYARIENYVHRLRVVIESLQAKQNERQWVKHQTSGDLDEGKIIDGITGEKNIYRRRADKKPEPGTPQYKPKRIRLCPDLSGSMYRFNGYDHRLEKSLEATLMLMKSFEGFEDKIKFEIVGHSGEQPDVELSTLNNPPKDDSDRLKILKSMLAHSQYCMSGDFTLESIGLATKICTREASNFDETFIILLSDANFRRYGISPDMLAKMLSPDSLSSNAQENAIHMFAIFIGSLGDEADLLKKRLPPNKAFVCKSTEEIPQIMQQILTSTVC